MKMTFMLGIFLLVLSCAGNAFGDVGPCNENYKFVCDDEGHCTCIKKGGQSKLRLVILDEPALLTGPGEVLEAVPGFDPDPGSACQIDYALQIRSLTGDILVAQRNHTLTASTPFDIYEHHPQSIRGPREWLKLDLTADGTDCSVEEVQSFRTHVATYHGRSGQTVYQATIHRFRLVDLAPGELPPILPADSTLRCGPLN